MDEFINRLDFIIVNRKKMTSPLYKLILSGQATLRLLQNFVIHRYPIKNFWTRNILGIASRIDDYQLRCELVNNIYEEETGALTHSKRHLQTFINFGYSLGLTHQQIVNTPILKETKALVEHNCKACNSNVHFTAGVASVLLLMEGQPPIISDNNVSMKTVMDEVYQLPIEATEFFTFHASSMEKVDGSTNGVSDLEDEHANTAREILRKYCNEKNLQQQAVDFLERAIELRHQHFDAIFNLFYNKSDPVFRYRKNTCNLV